MVKFPDGSILSGETWAQFINGKTCHPDKRKQHKVDKTDIIGMPVTDKNGRPVIIVGCNTMKNITVQYIDTGETVEHLKLKSVLKGNIKSDHNEGFKNHTGEVSFNTKGERMSIIATHGSDNNDVQFDDGTITQHVTYYNFLHGNVRKSMSEDVISVEGIPGKVVEDNGSHDITVRWDDGHYSYHLQRRGLSRGEVKHPARYGKKFNPPLKAGNMKITELAYTNNDTGYFFCECQKCKEKDILSYDEAKLHTCQEEYL